MKTKNGRVQNKTDRKYSMERSLLSTEEDIKRHKGLAITAINNMKHILW